jgi:hypothetical protein
VPPALRPQLRPRAQRQQSSAPPGASFRPSESHRPTDSYRPSESDGVHQPLRQIGQLAPMLGLDPGSIRLVVRDERGSEPRGSALPGAITLAGDLGDPVADPRTDAALLLHELVHIAQHANRSTSSRPPDVTAAEAEAAGIVAAHLAAAPVWTPREVLPSGYAARNGGSKGVVPAVGPPVVRTTDDRQALALVLTMLDTQPDDDQRRGAITLLVALAMQNGPAQEAASERLVKALKGEPVKNLFDHMSAIEDLKAWIPSHGQRAYDFILIGRSWFADHSKDEIGSSLSLNIFQKYLHYGRGSLAIAYLKQRLTGGGTLMPNLAARVISDLLELQSTPEAAKFQANYAALRAMAMANGWQSFGPLAAASSTPVIFAALDGIRQQAIELSRMVLLAPIGDPWGKDDVAVLDAVADGLSSQGVLRSATGNLIFTAENREETEHELLSANGVSTGQWLLEMSRTFAIALDAGSRLQERTRVLHTNALALDQVLGAQGRSSDERQALFDVRHAYVTAWVSVASLVFGGGRTDVARLYQSELDNAEWKFEHFDEALAARKFKGARARFAEYSRFFRQGNDSYPGNDQLDEEFFFVLRDVLGDEAKDLSGRLATGFSGRLGNGMAVNILPGEDDVPTDLHMVAALDRDVSIFGMQAALFLVYASNLSIHNMMIKADIGSKNFRAVQGKTLSDQRAELRGFCRTGDYTPFIAKAEAYQKTLKDVAENIKDRAKIDFLINLAITLIAALVTEGAALAVRLASLSELIALARTARAVASFSTLLEVGVFTASQLTLQKLFFGKEITGLDVIKTAATNLAFLGALKGVGKFAEPLTQGGAVRQLLFGHLVGFSGTAVVSLLLGRIETGQWPPDISTFLAETAVTYLLIAGMHHAFTELAAKPMLKGAATARLESLTAANEELMRRLRGKVDAANLTKAEFEEMRLERIRLLEEARAVAKVLKDGGVISAQELAAIERTADGAVAGATNARFPMPADPLDPIIRALPAPDSVIELTRVGDTNTYVYDPAKPRTKIDEMLAKYRAKGFTVTGTDALTRVVDPQGRTRFLLVSGPVPRTQLLLPAGIGPIADDPPLVRATGLRGPALDTVRASLAKINREAEAKLSAEYDDYAAVSTLSLLVEQASVIKPGWSIDAIRGLADALSLQRGIPRSAVRRLFQAVPPAQLPDLFAAYHDIVNSPKVRPGSQFLIADDLLPRRSVTLIEAWRKMKAAGLTLPPDMDMRATRGVDKQTAKQPGGWVDWIANIPVEQRATRLRSVSGLVDPSITLPTTTTQLLAEMTADLPGRPGLNALTGATPGDFVKALESSPAAGGFSEPGLRASFVSKVERLRIDVALLQQGAALVHGTWEGIVGRAKEVRRIAQVLLEGGQIVGSDRDVGPKGPVPNVDLANFALPGGGKVTGAPPDKNVHMDLLFVDAAGKLVAMEITTAELGLPSPWVSLDPKNPAYGANIDWTALDKPNPPSSYRKFMQAVKIYQLNKAGVALTSGTPAEMVMSAGDFTAPAARALEALGFKLEIGDGTRVTAAQVEARKKGGTTGP